MKIESLAGLGVIKVECGSQFSVALTRSGSVYTWWVEVPSPSWCWVVGRNCN